MYKIVYKHIHAFILNTQTRVAVPRGGRYDDKYRGGDIVCPRDAFQRYRIDRDTQSPCVYSECTF